MFPTPKIGETNESGQGGLSVQLASSCLSLIAVTRSHSQGGQPIDDGWRRGPPSKKVRSCAQGQMGLWARAGASDAASEGPPEKVILAVRAAQFAGLARGFRE